MRNIVSLKVRSGNTNRKKLLAKRTKLLLINKPIESESEYLADSNSLKDYDHAILVRYIYIYKKSNSAIR